MRILLINPGRRDRIGSSSALAIPQNTLPTIASLTPLDHVRIMDELVEKINFDYPADIVGITSMTDNACRAYEVADIFAAKRIPVVLGGPHPTVAPNEALKHADAVVIGEAEGVWQTIIDALRVGKRPQGIYRNETQPAMDQAPWPVRNPERRGLYLDVDMIQLSRGCPFQCEFCSVAQFFGQKLRRRSIKSILENLERLCGKQVFFVDDNLTGDRHFARELFNGMIGLGKRWVGQVTIATAGDEALIDLMAKSGCMGVFVGLESINQDSLSLTNKRHNQPAHYSLQIHRFRRAGIPVLGSFIFGFDADDETVFDRTLDFALNARLDAAEFRMLTPFPGTKLYERLERENRLLYRDWWLSKDSETVLFRPARMSPEALQKGWVKALRGFYCAARTGKRSLFAFFNYGPDKALIIGRVNNSHRGSAMRIAAKETVLA